MNFSQKYMGSVFFGGVTLYMKAVALYQMHFMLF